MEISTSPLGRSLLNSSLSRTFLDPGFPKEKTPSFWGRPVGVVYQVVLGPRKLTVKTTSDFFGSGFRSGYPKFSWL